VVIPTWNRAHTLEAALDGLAQQRGVTFEVIVVDAGSTDGTANLVAERQKSFSVPLRYLNIDKRSASAQRNAGVAAAQARFVAFTDSDCVPGPDWLRHALPPFRFRQVGAVQGPTLPLPGQQRKLLSHHIEITAQDGTYSTCNMVYRRRAIIQAGGFDPENSNFEDLDLGWRTWHHGWQVRFAPGAVVYHQVMPLTLWQWLAWPLRMADWPAKVRRHPEFRRYLVARLWVNSSNIAVELFMLGAIAGFLWSPLWVFMVPYAVTFAGRHGLQGRWPLAKVALNLAWDLIGVAALWFGSMRHRALVL
jgi:cellulose synthase/poly-beta-1,6-N-acetylglucosamine synthase-like glycosyltransferase